MMQAPEHNKRYSEGKEKSGNDCPDEKKSFLLEVWTGQAQIALKPRGPSNTCAVVNVQHGYGAHRIDSEEKHEKLPYGHAQNKTIPNMKYTK